MNSLINVNMALWAKFWMYTENGVLAVDMM